MRFDKFTVKAQQAIATAQEIAANSSHGILTPLHLLAGLLSDRNGNIIAAILQKAGCNADQIKSIFETEKS